MKAKFLVIVEKGDKNFSAYSPDLPGCIATGTSVDGTLAEMRVAIEFHLDGMIENGEELPVPRTLSTYIRETDEIAPDDILTTIEAEIPLLAAA